MLIELKVLYNDGEVEVLRLDKERWKLIDKTPKPPPTKVSFYLFFYFFKTTKKMISDFA